ncbi:MAG: hypothetical protein WBO97_10510 [Tepidiformaceae bacterium]
MNKLKILVLGAAAIIPAAATVLGASALGTNLISNGKFSSNVDGWDGFGGGNPVVSSGHLKVTNSYAGAGNSYASAWYCVSGIDDGKTYTTSVEAFVATTAPAHTGAALQLHYYTGNNCTGVQQAGPYKEIGKSAGERGDWENMSFNDKVPANMKSVRVRVSAMKEPVLPAVSIPATSVAFFDNAYFGSTFIVNPGLNLPGDLVMPTQKPPTATPTPPILVANPTKVPTTTPTPPILVANPTKVPTATPTPPIIVANPTTVPTATPTDEPADNPQDEPGDEPQDQPGGDPQDEPGGEPQDQPGSDNPGQGAPGGADETPPGAPNTGNSSSPGLITPETGMGLMLMAFGFGGGALALAFALRRRREDDDRE